MSINKTITVTLSQCCNKSVTTIDGVEVCDRCENVTDTYETEEEYYDEISADESRFLKNEADNN